MMCPRCGTRMRLAEMGPDNFDHEYLKFDCECDCEYQMAPSVQRDILNGGKP